MDAKWIEKALDKQLEGLNLHEFVQDNPEVAAEGAMALFENFNTIDIIQMEGIGDVLTDMLEEEAHELKRKHDLEAREAAKELHEKYKRD